MGSFRCEKERLIDGRQDGSQDAARFSNGSIGAGNIFALIISTKTLAFHILICRGKGWYFFDQSTA